MHSFHMELIIIMVIIIVVVGGGGGEVTIFNLHAAVCISFSMFLRASKLATVKA